MDHAEECCFVGMMGGEIHQISLLDPPRNVQHIADSVQHKFVGHEKLVNSLSVSFNSSQLLSGNLISCYQLCNVKIVKCSLLNSGSDDGTARIWDIYSGQCIRILAHRGPLTNAFFAPKFKHFETDQFQPSVIINRFEKKCDSQSPLNAEILTKTKPFSEFNLQAEPVINDELVQSNLQNVKSINHKLYAFAVKKILKKK